MLFFPAGGDQSGNGTLKFQFRPVSSGCGLVTSKVILFGSRFLTVTIWLPERNLLDMQMHIYNFVGFPRLQNIFFLVSLDDDNIPFGLTC